MRGTVGPRTLGRQMLRRRTLGRHMLGRHMLLRRTFGRGTAPTPQPVGSPVIHRLGTRPLTLPRGGAQVRGRPEGTLALDNAGGAWDFVSSLLVPFLPRDSRPVS